MSVPRPASTDSNAPSGSEPARRHACPDDDVLSRSYDAARFGVLACLLFMAGGLYWTAAIGLLTISAITAYPVMVSIGVAFTLMIFGAALWTPRRRASAAHSLWCTPEHDGKSTYDPVTGLPLNRLFLSLLNQALIRAQKHGRQVAVLIVELDYFTPAAEPPADLSGNLMCRIEAARVKSAVHTTDTVARLAERTFAVLLDQVTGPDEVLVLARKMQGAIALPITLDNHELFLSSRIGVGLSNRDDLDPTLLLEAATRALEAAQADASGMSGLEHLLENPPVDSTSTIAA